MTVDKDRGTGRTTKMIMELPDDGKWIIVLPNAAMRYYVHDIVRKHRPEMMPVFLRQYRVVRDEGDLTFLRGMSAEWAKRVFFDHSCFEISPKNETQLNAMMLATQIVEERKRRG